MRRATPPAQRHRPMTPTRADALAVEPSEENWLRRNRALLDEFQTQLHARGEDEGPAYRHQLRPASPAQYHRQYDVDAARGAATTNRNRRPVKAALSSEDTSDSVPSDDESSTSSVSSVSPSRSRDVRHQSQHELVRSNSAGRPSSKQEARGVGDHSRSQSSSRPQQARSPVMWTVDMRQSADAPWAPLVPQVTRHKSPARASSKAQRHASPLASASALDGVEQVVAAKSIVELTAVLRELLVQQQQAGGGATTKTRPLPSALQSSPTSQPRDHVTTTTEPTQQQQFRGKVGSVRDHGAQDVNGFVTYVVPAAAMSSSNAAPGAAENTNRPTSATRQQQQPASQTPKLQRVITTPMSPTSTLSPAVAGPVQAQQPSPLSKPSWDLGEVTVTRDADQKKLVTMPLQRLEALCAFLKQASQCTVVFQCRENRPPPGSSRATPVSASFFLSPGGDVPQRATSLPNAHTTATAATTSMHPNEMLVPPPAVNAVSVRPPEAVVIQRASPTLSRRREEGDNGSIAERRTDTSFATMGLAERERTVSFFGPTVVSRTVSSAAIQPGSSAPTARASRRSESIFVLPQPQSRNAPEQEVTEIRPEETLATSSAARFRLASPTTRPRSPRTSVSTASSDAAPGAIRRPMSPQTRPAPSAAALLRPALAPMSPAGGEQRRTDSLSPRRPPPPPNRRPRS